MTGSGEGRGEKMDDGRILLVEDDPNLGIILEESLKQHGFSVRLETDGQKGHDAFMEEYFDLCLIDVMLPVRDGFTLAGDIRRCGRATPIIFLTAKSLREDRIEGFKLGADDYVTKPFSMEELILRIRAVLRRSGKGAKHAAMERIRIGAYLFDPTARTLALGDDSRTLTGKEAELMHLLALHMNDVLSRPAALKKIWGDDNFFSSRSMDVYISKLRKYLSGDGSVRISNVHGKGFRLMVPARSD